MLDQFQKRLIIHNIWVLIFFVAGFLCPIYLTAQTIPVIDISKYPPLSILVGIEGEAELFGSQSDIVVDERFIYHYIPEMLRSLNKLIPSLLEDNKEKIKDKNIKSILFSWGYPNNIVLSLVIGNIGEPEELFIFSRKIEIQIQRAYSLNERLGLSILRADFGLSFKNETRPENFFLHMISTRGDISKRNVTPQISYERKILRVRSEEEGFPLSQVLSKMTYIKTVKRSTLVSSFPTIIEYAIQVFHSFISSDRTPPYIDLKISTKYIKKDLGVEVTIMITEIDDGVKKNSGLYYVLVEGNISEMKQIEHFNLNGQRDYPKKLEFTLHSGYYEAKITAIDLKGNRSVEMLICHVNKDSMCKTLTFSR